MTDDGAARMAALGEFLRARGFRQKRPARRLNRLLDAAFLDLVAMLPARATLEIGAHAAEFSRTIRRRLPGIPEVLAFEANPSVHERHLAAAQAAAVDYRNCAIADREGQLRLRVPRIDGRELTVMGSLRDAHSDRDIEVAAEFLVPAVTLDSLGVGGAAIWVDVEGALGEVIAGGRDTFATAVAVYAELDDQPQWPGGLVAGEAIAALGAAGLVPVLRDCQHPFAHNCIFLRRDILLGRAEGPGTPALLRWQDDYWRAARRIELMMPWWDARTAVSQALRRLNRRLRPR